LIDAVDRLSKAAAVPVLSDFDLGLLVRDVVAAEEGRHQACQVLAEGPDSLIVRTDANLLRLIVHNAIGNACESCTEVLEEEPPPVTVTWGETDTDVWISVLDRGAGLSEGGLPFEFGRTTKTGHDGVGLALARQAADSITASITLENRLAGGAAFELRWHRIPTKQ